jgi:hypothetical protein
MTTSRPNSSKVLGIRGSIEMSHIIVVVVVVVFVVVVFVVVFVGGDCV